MTHRHLLHKDDDPPSSEYIDDMAADMDSAEADGPQNDMDANTDEFSVDTKYCSGEEERTNSPIIINDYRLQDQPENLSNKSECGPVFENSVETLCA